MACTLAVSAILVGPTVGSTRAALQPTLPAACRLQHRQWQQRRSCAVRAAAQPEDSSGPVQNLARTAERMLARYDFLSAGMGAMVVTGFCVARGQDVGTALWITAAATIVAILVNDLLPEEH